MASTISVEVAGSGTLEVTGDMIGAPILIGVPPAAGASVGSLAKDWTIGLEESISSTTNWEANPTVGSSKPLLSRIATPNASGIPSTSRFVVALSKKLKVLPG